MRLLKSYGIATVIFTALLVSACNTDENPCPGVDVEVEIDSADMRAHISASGLENVAFDLFVNDQLVKSFDAGELDSADLVVEFEPGEYKVCVIAEFENCDQRIEGCSEFIIKDPSEESCLGLEFEIDKLSANEFKFIPTIDDIEAIEYGWYVDGDLVLLDTIIDSEVSYLIWDFSEGEHTVCLKAENDECGEVEYCKTIVAELLCPEEVYFKAVQDNPMTYYFYADFEGKEHVAYDWYVNDDLVEHENKDEVTDQKLIWQFNPGTYNVCLVVSQDGCNDVEYCQEIVIEEVECLDLSYTAEIVETDTTDVYKFTADFEGRDDITYIWKVYINDDFQGSEVRHAGSEDDHIFYWGFEKGVEYEICLKQDGGCEENQVCNVYSLP